MAEYRTHMKIIGDILTTTRDEPVEDEGASVTLSSSAFTDPGLGDTHTATIDWGDNIVESGTVTGTLLSSHYHSQNHLNYHQSHLQTRYHQY